MKLESTYSLHCSSFLGPPLRIRILNIELVKPKKATTMETIGRSILRVWRVQELGRIGSIMFRGLRGLGFSVWGF